MNRRLFLLIAFITTSICGMSQNIGDAFYIYRNDGEFNAFFKDEVISIEYSYEDIEGKTYEEVVTQIINTADSVYRIPLAVIDSISFVKPETKFQPNVVPMGSLINYLIAVDEMNLLFDPTIPEMLQPKVDEVLFYTDVDNPLLENGFAGRVLKTNMSSEAFRVECDSIYDIFDIYEQLISIERFVEERNQTRGIRDTVSTGEKSFNYNLGYSKELPNDGEVEIKGAINGTYNATLIYNITRKEQHVELRLNHDWWAKAHININSNDDFGDIGDVLEFPPLTIPNAPIFKFQISAANFVKGEGEIGFDLSINSPKHSYLSGIVYHNGKFRGYNYAIPTDEDITPNFEAAFSINGSIQTGCMIDFWLGIDTNIKGLAKDLIKLRTGLDIYLGPQIKGDFSVKVGKDIPIDFYSANKDTKISYSPINADFEFFGEAALAGHKFPKSIFLNGSIESIFNHEWYIFPEFSDPEISVIDKNKNEVSVSSTPSRDIFSPLKLGVGVFDPNDNSVIRKYEEKYYKTEDDNYIIKQSFASLETEKDYKARPFINFLGMDIPADPVTTFKLKSDELHDKFIGTWVGIALDGFVYSITDNTIGEYRIYNNGNTCSIKFLDSWPYTLQGNKVVMNSSGYFYIKIYIDSFNKEILEITNKKGEIAKFERFNGSINELLNYLNSK